MRISHAEAYRATAQLGLASLVIGVAGLSIKLAGIANIYSGCAFDNEDMVHFGQNANELGNYIGFTGGALVMTFVLLGAGIKLLARRSR